LPGGTCGKRSGAAKQSLETPAESEAADPTGFPGPVITQQRRKRAHSPCRMRRWEYLTLGVDERGGRVRLKSGEAIPDWRNGPRLEEQLNQAGEQGWELVGFEPRLELSFTLYVFKRPKETRTRIPRRPA
jgi:hypothetical protein